MTLIVGVLAIMAIPVTVAVFGAIIPRSPSRRRDALRALELLVRSRHSFGTNGVAHGNVGLPSAASGNTCSTPPAMSMPASNGADSRGSGS